MSDKLSFTPAQLANYLQTGDPSTLRTIIETAISAGQPVLTENKNVLLLSGSDNEAPPPPPPPPTSDRPILKQGINRPFRDSHEFLPLSRSGDPNGDFQHLSLTLSLPQNLPAAAPSSLSTGGSGE